MIPGSLLAPFLDVCFGPEIGHGAEFRAATDEHVYVLFESIGIVGGSADVLNVFPESFKILAAVVEDDHAIT